MSDPDRLTDRLLTEPDDRTFCEKDSRARADGYMHYGSPAITTDRGRGVRTQTAFLPVADLDRLAGIGIHDT